MPWAAARDSRALSPRPSGAPDGLVESARESLAAALGIASHLGDTGMGLATGARSTFVDGMGLAFVTSTVVLFAAAAVLLVAIPGRRPAAPLSEEEEVGELVDVG